MGLPTHMPRCNGTYTVRPAKSNNSLIATNNWICSLRVTYTVPPIFPRRMSYEHFAVLWNLRMRIGAASPVPAADLQAAQQAVQSAQNILNNLGPTWAQWLAGISPINVNGGQSLVLNARRVLQEAQQRLAQLQRPQRTWPIHFGISEGLYDDSKQITFEARWTLITSMSNIIVSSGIWTKTNSRGAWAQSVRAISGPQSWLLNKLDPSGQAIVDFGG